MFCLNGSKFNSQSAGMCQSRSPLSACTRARLTGNEEASNLKVTRRAWWVEYILVRLIQFVARVLQRIKVLTHATESDDVKSDPAEPATKFNRVRLMLLSRTIFPLDRVLLYGWWRCLRGLHTTHKLARLLPEDRIDLLDVSISKGWHQILALCFVFVAFRKQDTDTKQSAQTEADLRRLNEIVVASYENLTYSMSAYPWRNGFTI